MPTASDTLLQSQATGYLLGAPLLPQKSPHLLPRLLGVTNAPTLSISPRRGIAFRHLCAIVPVAGAAVSSAPPENGTGATTDRSTHLGDRFAAFPEERNALSFTQRELLVPTHWHVPFLAETDVPAGL
jgi:hypothetical protein